MKQTLITARSNPWVQQWLRYQAKPAERKLAGLAWLEGEHVVTEAMRRAPSNNDLLALVLPDTAAGREQFERFQPLLCEHHRFEVVWLSESVYRLLCTMDSVPGACAVMGLKAGLAINFTLPTVVLDGIQDPGNVGTLIRLCAAFGVPQVLLSAACASAWSSKSLRAGQGAQLAVKVHEDVDLNKAYASFKQQALPIAATSLTHGSVPLNHAALSQNMVWVFGSEGQGISAISQAAADQLIHIPMQGGFESLNVGTAAAICLWQWQQQP